MGASLAHGDRARSSGIRSGLPGAEGGSGGAIVSRYRANCVVIPLSGVVGFVRTVVSPAKGRDRRDRASRRGASDSRWMAGIGWGAGWSGSM